MISPHRLEYQQFVVHETPLSVQLCLLRRGSGEHYNMLVDGLDNKEDNDGGTLLTYSLEGVQEFKVLTSGSSAEYGRSPVSVFLATKSGTTQLGGSGFGSARKQHRVALDDF